VNIKRSWKQYFTEFIIQTLPGNPLFSTLEWTSKRLQFILFVVEHSVIFTFLPKIHSHPLKCEFSVWCFCPHFLNSVLLNNLQDNNPFVRGWKHQVHSDLRHTQEVESFGNHAVFGC
jgi:hypothetical protein